MSGTVYFSKVKTTHCQLSLREQLRNITPVIVIIFAATLVVLSVIIMIGMKYNVQLNHFTKDPVQIMNAPFYLGLFSNIGILLWCGSAVICFFSKSFIPKIRLRSAEANTPKFATCISPHDCTLRPEVLFLSLAAKSAAMMAAPPRRNANGEASILA